jgi:hypothetical protein
MISSDIRISYLCDTNLIENVIPKISTYFDSKSTHFLFHYKTTSRLQKGVFLQSYTCKCNHSRDFLSRNS